MSVQQEMWANFPRYSRGTLVRALESLDPDGADVKKGELGVVFEEAEFHAKHEGPLVRWFSGGTCNVYENQTEEVILGPSVGYHDIKVGMRFEEQQRRPARIVTVTVGRVYDCTVRVDEGRGTGGYLDMPRKRLSDRSQWRLLP